MRSLLAASLFAMLGVGAFAQGRGFGGHMTPPAPSRGFPSAQFGFRTQQRGFTGSVLTRPFFPERGRFSQGGFFFPWFNYGYPFLGGYDYGYNYPPEPPVIVVEPPPAPPQVIVQAPPKPIRPEIKEYHTPESGDSSPFSIALKDGSVRVATAVWVTEDTLHYIDREGKPGQAALDSIDRRATRKLNTGKNVQSWLPGD